MIINENILKQYISPLNYEIDKLKLLINNHMIEASSYCYFLNDNRQFIIGQIKKFYKINEFNNNYLVEVDIGEIIHIISLSPDLEVDKKVIIILKETYNFQNKKKNVEEKYLNNINSDAIFCSAKELNLNPEFLTDNEQKDILFLEDEASIGECALKYLGIKGFFLDLTLTPDRNDLLSYVGFAKDLKSILQDNQIKLKKEISLTINEEKKINPLEIKILTSSCFEYNIRYINNIKIDISPLWLRNKLFLHNIIPINNVIDVMNLILLEYGIPLNVFNATLLNDNLIQIRNAYEDEFFMLSNGQKHYFKSDDLVIENDNKIISIAGIKTNDLFEINQQTNQIILCSFYFKPESILKINKKLRIKNENFLRLSRGIDQNLLKKALDKAVFILQKITNCSVLQKMISLQHSKYSNTKILISLKFIYLKTGINFSFKQVYDFLTSLNYEIEIVSFQILKVKAPSHRYYIKIAEDVISDLIRMHGYNQILSYNLAVLKVEQYNIRDIKEKNIYHLRHLLSNLGLNETITYSLINDELFFLFSNSQKYLSIFKPLSYDKTILRQNLSCSLLEVLSYNQKNQNFDNSFFEIGNVYMPEQEELHLAIVLSGTFFNTGWLKKDIKSSFFLLKGILDVIQSFLDITFNLVSTDSYKNLFPSKQADIFFKEKKIGFIGQIHPLLEKKYYVKKSFVMEINLQNLLLKKKKRVLLHEISKFPSITRDFSFFVNKKYSFEQLNQTLKEEISSFFVKCELLDFFEKKNDISVNEYSLTFRLTFNSSIQNLNKEQVNDFMLKIESKMKKKYKIIIR
ncbi:phenylalanine--tRNA ligase, beta subunit [Candidatus Phytoplasma oryzae]|uniref:Phenylalanine--tRNA ligase beta subunit n=1 Tax=Candidatus Phytoplasma oryzae TaxID=203274 RepID=A0A139JR88_9MOLU|nr:phenylalanine--tRNA ligase subunit beta [Candidatus Phytoplasma oryzae]KXT29242.1 phenylalanine--tRNA ligase, beta subunit [Candidatus Phytoplasma oryzae]KXT29354.1 phenylalanine--tRNA ligase, beta subunit [Candidatus Phytoplasma oryzae]RAM57906.1 hypothetical protein DH96_01195 [Candidatus Phytoplasma oryzae]